MKNNNGSQNAMDDPHFPFNQFSDIFAFLGGENNMIFGKTAATIYACLVIAVGFFICVLIYGAFQELEEHTIGISGVGEVLATLMVFLIIFLVVFPIQYPELIYTTKGGYQRAMLIKRFWEHIRRLEDDEVSRFERKIDDLNLF